MTDYPVFPAIDKRPSVLILGGGPAGLTAGYELARSGRYSVMVIEKQKAWGGLARTLTHRGYRFDIGGHRWFTKNESLNKFLKSLLGDELRNTRRVSRIYLEGKFYDYPLKLGPALMTMGPVTAAKAGLDYLLTHVMERVSPRPVISMEDAYRKQFGNTLYRMFFKQYSEKVWGIDCSEASADWVDQRVKGMSIVTAVLDALIKSRTVASLIDEFVYPRKGIGRISERLAEEIESMGGITCQGWEAAGINTEEGRVKSVTARRENEEYEIPVDYLLSTIPLNEFCMMFDPPLPGGVLNSAGLLRFRDLITVNLVLSRPKMTDDTWIYIHDKDILLGRLHEPKNWSPEMVPDPYRTSVVAEYFCSRGDEIWRLSDQMLVDITSRDLATRMQFINLNQVEGGFVARHPNAYPFYDLDYRKNLGIVRPALKEISNLQVLGRSGLFRYNNMDHSIETGLLAARNLLGEKHDLDAVNMDAEYHEIIRRK
ncbi:MAG: FAD-dependent oxidoreductase [Chloroflexi bacterium]|nr:FAD-dependent oxidoreductase [Chloroflexota bacterium]